MILEQLKVLDVQRVGNTDEGIKAGIDESSLPFVFELVSKQLYSNPIGSMIRELTSNCFDSHIEAGVDDPVIINRGFDAEEGYYIEFKDVGVGISPDRITSIYMNYFSSTKRESNNQIGAFGIGSKTPLAYTDLFYIVTIFDGVKYEYVFHRGEEKPTLELLSTEEGITEHNGTTIKVYMAKSDLYKFEDELKFQLAYFDNVWITGWSISNNYDIYEGKHFKFRSDISQRSTNIHICVGKVRYPIDLNTVRIPTDYQRIPIAVKFEIGELRITPSRETLRYDPEGIKLIQDRVNLAIAEILELFNKQNPEAETLEQYITAVRNDNPRIVFDSEKGHELYIWANSGLSKNYKFKPLSGIKIKKTPKELFFMWEAIGNINYEGVYKENNYVSKVDNVTIAGGKYVILNKEDRQSKYTNIFIQESMGSITLIRRKEIDYNEVAVKLGLKDSKEIGKAKVIMEYLRITSQIVRERGRKYSECRPTEEWIEAYKKSVKESSIAWQRKMQNKIFVRDIARGGRGIDITVGEVCNRTGILVYGFKEDKSLLEHIYNTVSLKSNMKEGKRRKKNRGFYSIAQSFAVLQIAQAVEKSIVGAKKTIYCKDFLNTRFVKKLETLQYLYEEIQGLGIISKDFRDFFIKDFSEEFYKLEFSVKGFSYHNYSIPRKGIYIEEMLIPLRKFKENFLYPLPPLVKYIDSFRSLADDTIAKKQILAYLKPYKIRLRNNLYLKDKKQLECEAGIRSILAFIKNPVVKNNLLTYNLKQTENDKD